MAASWKSMPSRAFGRTVSVSQATWRVALIIPLYFPTAWFARLKARRRDIAWLKYF